MDRGEINLAVMADYSKAFDTVDYMKHSSQNFTKQAFQRTQNILFYLSNRKQYVESDCDSSKHLIVTNGVPKEAS